MTLRCRGAVSAIAVVLAVLRPGSPVAVAQDAAPGPDPDAAGAVARLDRNLSAYLTRTDWPGAVTEVAAGDAEIGIRGIRPEGVDETELFLVESPPWEHVTELKSAVRTVPVPMEGQSAFHVRVRRMIDWEGRPYDRLLSRWFLARRGNGGLEPLSAARWADSQPSRWNDPEFRARGRKGLGGFHLRGAPVSDLDDLGITSVTVNIPLDRFLAAPGGDNAITHTWQGVTLPIHRGAVESFDRTFRECARRNLLVLGILLVGKANRWPGETGRLFAHPDCDPSAHYAMPNLENADGLLHYAALLDFLAARYSRPDAPFGRVHHWIMHNEADAGWEWTNCGDKPALVFLDLYHKSMRVAHLVLRQYQATSRVMASFTHHWAVAGSPRFYGSRRLLEYLLAFGRAEGDFDWGIAYHPYPQDLFEPRTWLDEQAQFTFDTPKITFRNIEVLNEWVKQPAARYRGSVRMVHLTEQGPNSRDYSDGALRDQAAAMAYVWKKLEHCDAIQGWQYHNWVDNAAEGGLRIGLRQFYDGSPEQGRPKPVWHVYKALGTPQQEEAIAFAKEVIGIRDWSEIAPPQPLTR